MANEVARPAAAGAIASLSNLKTGLQNVASAIVARGGDPFLRLLTDGSWVYGADNVEVEEGSLWALNPHSLQHGWVSWTDRKEKGSTNEVVGEVMVPLTSSLPDASGLRDTGWSWTQQLSLQLQCISGEDVGTSVRYKTTSVGGTNALKGLINKLIAQLDVDPAHPVPIVELLSEHYQHKTYGRTYAPIFEVKSWSGLDAVTADEVPADDAGDEVAPPPAEPSAADQLLEQEAARAAASQPNAPVRRRRR